MDDANTYRAYLRTAQYLVILDRSSNHQLQLRRPQDTHRSDVSRHTIRNVYLSALPDSVRYRWAIGRCRFRQHW